MGDEAGRKRRVAALGELSDDRIDTSDVPEVTDWSGAVRGLYRPRKERITIMLDADILAHFRALAGRSERGYQTEINRALRDHLSGQKRGSR